MASHSHFNPDKDECRRRILDIDDKIPKRQYARSVQKYLRSKDQPVPTISKINNVRNLKQFDLDIVEALEAIVEEEKKLQPKRGAALELGFDFEQKKTA